jgi:hypothetical protein
MSQVIEPAGHWEGRTFKLDPPVHVDGTANRNIEITLTLPETETWVGLPPGSRVSMALTMPPHCALSEVTPTDANCTHLTEDDELAEGVAQAWHSGEAEDG